MLKTLLIIFAILLLLILAVVVLKLVTAKKLKDIDGFVGMTDKKSLDDCRKRSSGE